MSKVAFDTTLSQFGNNTGVEIPNEIIEKLNAQFYFCSSWTVTVHGGDAIHVELAVAKAKKNLRFKSAGTWDTALYS